jgi:hypothetical protein
MSHRATLFRLVGPALALGLASGTGLAQGDARPAPAAVETEATTLAGLWDLRIDGTTVFRFEIIPVTGGGWRGRWSRPDSFNSNGDAFANLRGPVRTSSSMTGNAIFELVELAFDDPRPGAVPDIFRFRQTGSDTAEMLYVGTPLAPYRLVRAEAGDLIGHWEEGRIYRRPPPGPRPASPPTARPVNPAAAPVPALPEDRVIIGPQVQFLDLTSRPAEDPPGVEEQLPPATGKSAAEAPDAPPPEADPPRIDASFLDGL